MAAAIADLRKAAQPQGGGVNWRGVADQQKEIVEQQQNLIASLRAELAESYRIDGKPQVEPVANESRMVHAFCEHAKQFTFKNHPATPAMFPIGFPWFKAGYERAYAEQPAPVAVVTPKQLITAIETEQARLSKEDYLMDSEDCVKVIREEVTRLNTK
ncbi:hypothetical protein IB241_15865 [Pseudomonas sp. PDM05]|uniref:hypothetical protein n=1 Tax=Pseudomonas sp. PDM05 TaxID=2769301 RepID=UPI001786CA90|nr:hypothetical protein [Pseudomonas sp. PDM05]MBD9459159.1 hypothetical protein [Pseudomonas sp. PDM05]